jgi:hypothetical protein
MIIRSVRGWLKRNLARIRDACFPRPARNGGRWGSTGGSCATNPSPADFPLGSPQSRAAARFRLQRIALAGEHLPHCICFPANEHPSFGFRVELEIAARVKCPIHGTAKLLASVNQGRPPIAATPKPAEFSGHGIATASHVGAPYKVPENRMSQPRPPNASSPRENRPENKPPRPETEPRMTVPSPDVPRPPSASQRENAPRGENNPRPQRDAPRESPASAERGSPRKRAPSRQGTTSAEQKDSSSTQWRGGTPTLSSESGFTPLISF